MLDRRRHSPLYRSDEPPSAWAFAASKLGPIRRSSSAAGTSTVWQDTTIPIHTTNASPRLSSARLGAVLLDMHLPLELQ